MLIRIIYFFLFAFFTIKNLDRFAKRISSLYNDSRKLDEDDKDNKALFIYDEKKKKYSKFTSFGLKWS